MLEKKLLCLMIICLSSLISCENTQWNWVPNAYYPDVELRKALNSKDSEISFDDPIFNSFACFPEDNLQELIENIKKLPISQRKKSFLLDYIKSNVQLNLN